MAKRKGKSQGIGGSDVQFYSDIHDGMNSAWKGLPATVQPGKSVTIHKEFTVPEKGRYILQYRNDTILKVAVNSAVFAGGTIPQFGAYCNSMPVELEKGVNTVRVTFTNELENPQEIKFVARLLDPAWQIIRDPVTLFPETAPGPCRKEPDLAGFRPGAGAAFKTCGRFGFTKGDGVLDYTMAGFGVISRPFLNGNPQYHHLGTWHISFLPEGEKESASTVTAYKVPGNETIETDWSRTRWERRLAKGKFIAFDYSVMTPALLIESDLDTLRMDRLAACGGFRKITFPTKAGAVTKEITDGIFYDSGKDGEVTENWLLFSSSGRFPEIPVLLVVRKTPKTIFAQRTAGGILNTLTVDFGEKMQWAMLEMPYGIKLFKPEELTQQWLEQTIALCREKRHEMMARPCACKEYFRFENGSEHIIQKFEYRTFKDSFGTFARFAAPVPPPLAIAAPEVSAVRLDAGSVPLDFPTKYGPMTGVKDSTWSEYFVPVESSRCEIAFPAEGQERFGKMIHRDFDAFMKYYLESPTVLNPGCYYFVFQYSFVARLLAVLKKEDRKRLEDIIRDGLKKVCDPDYEYVGPGNRKCLSWYLRTEPFSKVSWYSTYLHVSGISRYANCDRKTIENADFIMIETDWGNAMALYGTWLGTLLTGEWKLIRDHWKVFRKAFDFYLVMMDWACMTTGYCENSLSWNDGTNFGAYTAYMSLAEMTGNTEDFELARYAYSKMTAMRLGLYYCSQKYLYRYLDVKPWYVSKFFHEEISNSSAFTSYPANIIVNGYRTESLYNMSTEGHYKEAWNLYWKHAPEETKKILSRFEKAAYYPLTGPRPAGSENIYHSKTGEPGWQEVMTYLMFCIMSGRFSPEKLEKMINDAADNCRISKEFLGHVEWSRRRVPAEWAHVYLLTMLYGRNQPKLAAWQGLRIEKAAYPELSVTVSDADAWLEVSSPRRPRVTMNGKALEIRKTGNDLYRMTPGKSGKLVFS